MTGWHDMMLDMVGNLEKLDNVETWISPRITHCISGTNVFYRVSNGSEKLVDWLVDLSESA